MQILGPALEEDDEARAGAEMDIEVERQIIEDICKELKEMEEEAKRAEEQQRLKQEEYERAARVRLVTCLDSQASYVSFISVFLRLT